MYTIKTDTNKKTGIHTIKIQGPFADKKLIEDALDIGFDKALRTHFIIWDLGEHFCIILSTRETSAVEHFEKGLIKMFRNICLKNFDIIYN